MGVGVSVWVSVCKVPRVTDCAIFLSALSSFVLADLVVPSACHEHKRTCTLVFVYVSIVGMYLCK